MGTATQGNGSCEPGLKARRRLSSSSAPRPVPTELQWIAVNCGRLNQIGGEGMPCHCGQSYPLQHQRPSRPIVLDRGQEEALSQLVSRDCRPLRVPDSAFRVGRKYQLPSTGSLIVCWAFREVPGRETVLSSSHVRGGLSRRLVLPKSVKAEAEQRRTITTLKTIPCSAGCSEKNVASVCDRRHSES